MDYHKVFAILYEDGNVGLSDGDNILLIFDKMFLADEYLQRVSNPEEYSIKELEIGLRFSVE